MAFSTVKFVQEISKWDLKKADIADGCGIHASKLSQILAGRLTPTPELARRFTFLMHIVATSEKQFIFTAQSIRWLRRQMVAMERSIEPSLQAAQDAAEQKAAEAAKAAIAERKENTCCVN